MASQTLSVNDGYQSVLFRVGWGAAQEPLVPIRVDVQLNDSRVVDAFLWNRAEQRTTPESFALQLLRDLQHPSELTGSVATAIREQVEQYTPFRPELFADHTELRLLFTLDVRIGHVQLQDTFEWDVLAWENDPEQFSRMLCRELGLGTEFTAAIAHAIREQLQDVWAGIAYSQKSVLESVQPRVALREGEEWELPGPTVRVLNKDELEEVERREDRNARAMRRSQRKSGMLWGFSSAPLPRERTRDGEAFFGSRPAPEERPKRRRNQNPLDSEGRPVVACSHCGRHPSKTPLMRVGPRGLKNEICNSCGLYFRKYGELPTHYKGIPIGPGFPPPPGSQENDP
ncbi:hypothetical protein CCYA_CCYA07G2164 [Cyanidiococcus yangmingshanensis]|nr:hypothetical protein CCYA_CCYA07G2164 [Cyanidiococcus yangmingshanensis]